MRMGGLAECAGVFCQASHPQVCQLSGVPGVPGVAAMRAILPSVLSVSDALNALQLLAQLHGCKFNVLNRFLDRFLNKFLCRTTVSMRLFRCFIFSSRMAAGSV